MSLTFRTVEVDDPGLLLPLLPAPGGLAWVRDGEGLVGWGEAFRIEPGTGESRFDRAVEAWWALRDRAVIDDPLGLPGTGPVAFGSFTFDPRRQGSVLLVPEVVVGRRGGRAWVTVVGDADPAAALKRPAAGPAAPGIVVGAERIRYAGASVPDLAWLEAVAEAIRRIEAPHDSDSGSGSRLQRDSSSPKGGSRPRSGSSSGPRLAKVVLARDHAVWSKTPFDDRVLLARLAERFPSCFTFLCDGLVGATPELLVSRSGDQVASLVLAGSAERGQDSSSDEILGKALLESVKDREEHDFAVASVRDGLAPLCATLDVEDEPALLRLDNVQHLATAVRGQLSERQPSLALAGRLHPTAAVGGAPAAAALETIRELEGLDRGRYSGPVGWMDARGDGEWGIALRCAELSGARARLFAGAGIVRGSLPEAELEETRLKLRAMLSALESPDAGLTAQLRPRPPWA